jgi:hypothetical protein
MFEQDNTQLAQQRVLSAVLDDDGQLGSEIGGLHSDLGALVGEAPENSGDDLRQVGFCSDTYNATLATLPHRHERLTKCIDNGTETIKHDVILQRLLGERINDTVDQLNL